jgi:hypothetical protein
MHDCTVLDSHNCTVLDSHKWIVTLVLEWQSHSCGGAFSARLLLYGSDSVRCITANQFGDYIILLHLFILNFLMITHCYVCVNV